MNEYIAKLMTEEEFNSLSKKEKNAIEKFSNLYKSTFDWLYLTNHGELTEDSIRKFADRVNWDIISERKNLTDKFIEDFKDKLNWVSFTRYQKFNKEQLIKYVNYINWDMAPVYQPLMDEEIIDVVMASPKKDELNWHGVAVMIKMSEQFIEKYADAITKANKWELISYYQTLSEEFMERHADILNWNYLCQKQNFSREFMVKHFDKLNTMWAKKYQKNWDDNIEKDYERYKLNIDPENKNKRFLIELKELMDRYEYDKKDIEKLLSTSLSRNELILN